MAVMEFLTQNLLNTTSMISVPAAQTGTVQYLFDRNRNLGFSSVGYTSNTSLVITITFPSPTVVSNILFQNHNLAGFRAFYDGVTANSLGIVAANTQAHTYLNFASTTVSSISLQLDSAQTADTERNIAELVISEKRLQFERMPSHKDFDPVLGSKRVVHEMPDGGTVQFNISKKFKARMKWGYLSDSFISSLLSVYEESKALYFVPFPTTTAWGGKAYEVLWANDFDFTHDENSKTQGQGGEIRLTETPGA